MIPGFYEVISGPFCAFHEVKKAGNMVVIAKKCMKKDLMKLVLWASQGLNFLTFERNIKGRTQDTKKCPWEDARVCPSILPLSKDKAFHPHFLSKGQSFLSSNHLLISSISELFSLFSQPTLFFFLLFSSPFSGNSMALGSTPWLSQISSFSFFLLLFSFEEYDEECWRK